MTVEELKVKISADTKAFTKSLESAIDDSEELRKEVNDLIKDLKSFTNFKGSTFKDFFKVDMSSVKTQLATSIKQLEQMQSRLKVVNMAMQMIPKAERGNSGIFGNYQAEITQLQSSIAETERRIEIYKKVLTFQEQNKHIQETAGEFKNVGTQAGTAKGSVGELGVNAKNAADSFGTLDKNSEGTNSQFESLNDILPKIGDSLEESATSIKDMADAFKEMGTESQNAADKLLIYTTASTQLAKLEDEISNKQNEINKISSGLIVQPSVSMPNGDQNYQTIEKLSSEIEQLKSKAELLREFLGQFSIHIDDTQVIEATESIEELKAKKAELQAQLDNFDRSTKLDGGLSGFNALQDQIEELDQKIKSMEKVKPEADTYALEEVQEKAEEAKEAIDEISSTTVSPKVEINTSGIEQFKQKANNALDSIMEKMQALFPKSSEAFSKFGDQFKNMVSQINGTNLSSSSNSSFENFRANITSVWDTIKSGVGAVGTFMGEAFGKVSNVVGNIAGKLGIIGTVGVKAISAVVSVTNNLAKKMNILSPIVKKVGNALKSLGNRIKNVFIYSTIINFFNKMKSTIGDYLGSNTELQNALGALKGSFLTAFQPIYEAVVPMLITLVQWLTKAANSIAAFFAAMNGKSVKAMSANAKALYAQASATDAAGSAAEEAQRQVMGFDEINKLSDNSSSSGSSSSDTDYTTFGDIDESSFTSWGDAFSGLLDKLIAKLPAFSDLMTKCGEKINDFNTKLQGVFSPANIAKVNELATGIASGLNNLVSTVDFQSIGNTIGNALTMAYQSVTNFITNINWSEVGSSLAQGINGIFENFKASDIIANFEAKVSMVWDTLGSFFGTLDWEAIGSWIAEGLNSMDIQTVISKIWNTIHNLVSGATETLKTILEETDWEKLLSDTWESLKMVLNDASTLLGELIKVLLPYVWQVIKDAIENLPNLIGEILGTACELIASLFKGLGMDGAAGFFEGLGEDFKDALNWIQENIFDPIMNGIKKLFGIASPSKEMSKIGGFLAEGLLGGIKEKWKNITGWLGDKCDAIKDTVKSKWETVKETTSSIWGNIKEKISSPLKESTKSTSDEMNSMNTTVDTQTKKMQQTITNLGTQMKSTFTSIFSSIKSSMSTIFSAVATQVSKSMTSIKTSIQNTVNSLKGAFNINAGRITFTVPKFTVQWQQSRYGTQIAYVPNIYPYSYQTYATGGFPEDGMFFANSSELVGQFSNGKTAVANNAQIIEGIKQGVETGLLNAISKTQSANTNDKNEINVYLDGAVLGQKIYPYIKQQYTRHGTSLIGGLV